jgi:myosin-1
MKPGFPISDLTGVSVSPGPDQLAIVHLQGGNDLVVCLTNKKHEERVGELVGTLAKIWEKANKRDLRVVVGNQLHCTLGEKARTVSVEMANSGPVFKKNGGNGLILQYPSMMNGN